MTLRTRFALWVSALMLAALAAFGTFVYFTISRWLSAAVDDTLRLSAGQLIHSSDVDQGHVDLSDDPVSFDSGLAEELRSQGLTVQVFDTTGTPIQSYGATDAVGLDAAALSEALAGNSTLTTRPAPGGTGSLRVFTQPIVSKGAAAGVVQVSQSLDGTESLQRTLLASLLLGSPILVAVAALGGYLLARRALAPIDQITRTARRISAEDLSGRLDLPPSRDEVGRLAATFDDMLGRLEGAFRREHQFTHDAAHELRTPLAAIKSILTVTAQRPRTPQEYQTALADLADETDRLTALTDDLLRLARTEDPTELSEPVDLSTLVPDVVDSMRPLAEARGLSLRHEVDGGLRLTGDTDALIRLLVNLVDNAIKYTHEGGITVSARAADDRLVIEVADTGDGIAPEHLPHVFERFYRADEARTTPGTGLGLAICEGIAQAHGGTIAVRSIPALGSTFTVTLPRPARDPRRQPTPR